MDLSDTLDWESDPELKVLLEEFMAAFQERRAMLLPVIALSEQGMDSASTRRTLQFVAHKIAGVAATFGFPALSDLGGEIDFFMHGALQPDGNVSPSTLASIARLLDEAMADAEATRKDPAAFLADPRRKQFA